MASRSASTPAPGRGLLPLGTGSRVLSTDGDRHRPRREHAPKGVPAAREGRRLSVRVLYGVARPPTNIHREITAETTLGALARDKANWVAHTKAPHAPRTGFGIESVSTGQQRCPPGEPRRRPAARQGAAGHAPLPCRLRRRHIAGLFSQYAESFPLWSWLAADPQHLTISLVRGSSSLSSPKRLRPRSANSRRHTQADMGSSTSQCCTGRSHLWR